jgi:hypothetical protein
MGRIRRHLTFANIVSLIALFVALGGTALASVIITSNSQVAKGTISGHKPPSGDHSNIIPGSVNGQDVADNSLTGADILESSLTGDARALIYDGSPSSGPKTLATVGGYTLKAECGFDQGSVVFVLTAKGPAGGENLMFSRTDNDTTDLGNGSLTRTIPAGKDTGILQFEAPPGHFQREAGTAMLRAGPVLVQVDFNAVAKTGSERCFLRGTATRGT